MMTKPDEELAHLQQAVSELTSQVKALAARLDALHRGTSMRAQCRCPACGCRKILHSAEVPDVTESGISKASVAVREGWIIKRAQGPLHAYICTACGLTEWHVPEVAELEIDDKQLRLLDATPPKSSSPYR